MSIPPEISNLYNRIEQELSDIQKTSTEALSIVRVRLDTFPNNQFLIKLYASLSNYLVFVEISKRRSDYAITILSSGVISSTSIQEAGEILAELWGRVIETKEIVENLRNRLDDLS